MSVPPPSDEHPPGRRALAAPAAIGVVAAVGSALAAATNIWDLPVAVSLGVTGTAAMLAGVLAWATATPSKRRQVAGPDGPVAAELPPVIAHFTGRGEALADLRERFRDRTGDSPFVVSIYGQGGVGKSALASRFAHDVIDDFPDGQLYFDLRAGDDLVRPEDVLVGFLRSLGVRLTTDPGGLRELQKLWWTWTKDRRLLIFLDNAQDGDQVKDLIPTEPRCAVVVTSRKPLLLRNTYDTQLHVFTEAQGVELLARLAGGDRVVADLESAQTIVRLCDRLPLAISICGGRLATRGHWSLRDLAHRLEDERRRLDQLEIGRQLDGSVRASLQLSYEECTDLQRRLLRLLSQLTAPDVPEWVAGDLLDTSETDGADQLEMLVTSQLAECTGHDTTGGMRYRLHDLVRLFAREQRLDPAQRRAAIERVLYGFRRRAEAAATARWPQDWTSRAPRRSAPDTITPIEITWPRLDGEQTRREITSAAWFTSERLALLAAIHQARNEGMWELAWGMGRAFCSLCHSLRAYWSDWEEVAGIACEAAERLGDPRAQGIALLERSAVAGGLGRPDEAIDDARHALELLTEAGESWWAARAMRAIGMSLFNSGHLDLGRGHLVGAVAAFKEEGDRWWTARTQRNLAELLLAQGGHGEAAALLEQSLATFEADANRYSEAQTQRALGEVLAAKARALDAAGDELAAERQYILAGNALRFAVKAFQDRHEEWEQARSLRAAGEIGDPRNGLTEYANVRDAKEMLARLGDSWGVARAEISEGRALERLGRVPEAVGALRRAVGDFEALGDRWWQARSLRTEAEILLRADRREEAREPARQALDIYLSLGNEAGARHAREVLERAESPRY
ncbi:SARP family transcriptional regulator [Acrocarpospora phusangensis]|uniref:SARP family transcriptional regulator n=1 Tax=Acrocarpospora phusangensis TaxID=1070424 RepID=A0A919QG01_9ACTN|nr:tetratricopeptide repeat protein [Acrocarpospora phusangensis]GIH28439.1 SARP family transcriptional regulator [Acrocarpospora phusangensis]